MHTTRKGAGLVFITGLWLSAALFAQGAGKAGGGQEQSWHRFEKELGLQTRYAVEMEVQAMGMVMPSKTFRLDGKTRTETTLPMINLRMVALELTENGKTVTYSLFPDKKKYCIEPREEEDQPDAAKQSCKLEELGSELYEGVTCKKRRMTVVRPDEGTQVMEMLLSPAQKNMPVKMTATAQMVTEPGQPPMTVTSVILFRNYRFGAPDANLFVIPKDYTQAKDMAEIMMGGGGLFGLPQQPGAAPAAAGGLTLPPEALEAIRQAQAEEAKATKENAKDEAAGEGVRQGLQGLRRLFGQ